MTVQAGVITYPGRQVIRQVREGESGESGESREKLGVKNSVDHAWGSSPTNAIGFYSVCSQSTLVSSGSLAAEQH